MSKKGKLDNLFIRLVALAAVLLVVVYFMLDKKFGNPPELEDAEKYTIFLKPAERGMDRASLAPTTMTSAEIGEFKYEPPAFRSAFGARTKEIRLLLAKIYGGGDDTEAAVEMGLAYLAGIQNEDGSWSAEKHPVGSTGIAMLCFLGAGYDHMNGDYREVIGKGLQYLLDMQDENGRMKRENLYTCGIAGTVFVEGYGLTGDSKLKESSLKMMDYLVKSQGPKGGWAYEAYTEETLEDTYTYDTSVTGWIVMFFKSAHMVGLPTPRETIARYKKYALLITGEDGQAHYGLKKGVLDRPTETMTASTLMCRFYMGEGLDARFARAGLDKLTRSLEKDLQPKWIEKNGEMDVYLWYHAAQVAFLVGQEPWAQWNNMLKDLLVKNQIKDGPEKGSWKESYFKQDGKSDIYATTLSIMILETYYRYYK